MAEVLAEKIVTYIRDGDYVKTTDSDLIRCRNCKYWDGHWAGLNFTMCKAFDWKSKAEDFCSFAERKEE